MSFINIKNNKNPRTVPSGNPEGASKEEDFHHPSQPFWKTGNILSKNGFGS